MAGLFSGDTLGGFVLAGGVIYLFYKAICGVQQRPIVLTRYERAPTSRRSFTVTEEHPHERMISTPPSTGAVDVFPCPIHPDQKIMMSETQGLIASCPACIAETP